MRPWTEVGARGRPPLPSGRPSAPSSSISPCHAHSMCTSLSGFEGWRLELPLPLPLLWAFHWVRHDETGICSPSTKGKVGGQLHGGPQGQDKRPSSWGGRAGRASGSHLGEAHGHLRDHVIPDKTDHPDGPGARAFYELRFDSSHPREFRAWLHSQVAKTWPREVSSPTGKANCLGFENGYEDIVTAEFIQFQSCAMGRFVEHEASGKIPAHLARNSALEAPGPASSSSSGVAMKRPAAAAPVVQKRPSMRA